MLYFNAENYSVIMERPEEDGRNYESFTPTLNFDLGDEGHVVVVEYTTYDSFNSYDDPQFEVVDAYLTYEEARNVAKAISDDRGKRYIWNRMTAKEREQKPELEPGYGLILANGKTFKPHAWTGWGTSFSRVIVSRFVLAHNPSVMFFN